ncbi:MAG TPA: endonuclease III [Planctomycetaceae bacterium]|nr:endonuclease III [Planctomycetaceae bacterium]
MRKQERADWIAEFLDKAYPETPIPLDHRDPFTLLIAVLLSAQCTDKMVNLVTPGLWELADNPVDMARRTEAEILQRIQKLGLARRKSAAIKKLSQILVDEFDAVVPENFADLESLPGVGHKTASVVMSQAFGHPAFPVDTHIHRLAQRWKLTNGKHVEQTEKDLKQLFPKESWNRLHLQIIFYGREHCTARGCDGTKCEVCRTLFPRRRKAVETKRA